MVRRATRIAIAALVLAAPGALRGQGQRQGHDSTHAVHDSAMSRGMPGTGMSGMNMGAMPGGQHRPPPMPPHMPMVPWLKGFTPPVTPWLPGDGENTAALPEAVPGKVVNMRDGDTLHLAAEEVKRTLRGHRVVMYGFNGEYPGPLIHVKQGATIVVDFVNRIDLPTTVHWHGVRIDNRYDGVPDVTQKPVPPGGRFVYHVHFRDAGIYWYHPHVRTDVEQNLGLYGNMLVDSPDPHYYNPVNRAVPLILNDLLMDKEGLFPFGKDVPDFTIMGRWGNVFLINGEPDYRLAVNDGDVVRFYVTSVSSARMYNVSFGGLPIKLVAADLGKFEHEQMVHSVVIAPAQRYVVDVHFTHPGTYAITNRVQALSNWLGEYFPEVDTLGLVTVARHRSAEQYAAQFATLRENRDVTADIARYRQYFERPPDKSMELTVNIQGLPVPAVSFMAIDTMYYSPVEWNDGMPMMNWISTAKETHWILRDTQTGREGMAIGWHFTQGSVVKIRLHNDANSMHPMAHPIHIHGQRFLVLDRDGVPNKNLVWKDTVLIPVGSTVDILLDADNPGKWLMHCHISEHIASGMKTVITVDPAPAG